MRGKVGHIECSEVDLLDRRGLNARFADLVGAEKNVLYQRRGGEIDGQSEVTADGAEF